MISRKQRALAKRNQILLKERLNRNPLNGKLQLTKIKIGINPSSELEMRKVLYQVRQKEIREAEKLRKLQAETKRFLGLDIYYDNLLTYDNSPKDDGLSCKERRLMKKYGVKRYHNISIA